LQGRIPGARFFDLNLFMESVNGIPNMLIRDEKLISERLGMLGITNDCKIIFYDHAGFYPSCRALWMLKVFGHNPNQLYILDSGFASWQKYGGKIETEEPRNFATKSYTVNFEAHFIRTLVQMKTNLHHPEEQVIDVRHPVRYAGGPEPRAGLRSGHIPNSFSFPFMTMFDKDQCLKPLEKIRKQLASIGVDLNSPVVTMCGSGMTASALSFILDLLNHPQHALYDGSWSEWGADRLYQGEENLEERPVIRSLDY
jgi:thiosulfate/3-mercaptopyruvate sulfurtransferase